MFDDILGEKKKKLKPVYVMKGSEIPYVELVITKQEVEPRENKLPDGWVYEQEVDGGVVIKYDPKTDRPTSDDEIWDRYKSAYRIPEPHELELPEFDHVWGVIKKWDIDDGKGPHGAEGNNVVAILDALRIDKIRNCRDIQITDGNWDYCEYMRGMANGLILAMAIIEDKRPEYKDVPPAGYRSEDDLNASTVHDYLASETMLENMTPPVPPISEETLMEHKELLFEAKAVILDLEKELHDTRMEDKMFMEKQQDTINALQLELKTLNEVIGQI